jgi:pimeloyl-ACP methyl ester carboxylesterase
MMTALLDDEQYASAFAEATREGLRQGTSGAGWDYVALFGEWDFELGAVRCPVLLWYGGDDRSVPLAHGRWLSENLPAARLVVHEGEGHLGIYEHFGEMLDALTEPDTADTASTSLAPAATSPAFANSGGRGFAEVRMELVLHR